MGTGEESTPTKSSKHPSSTQEAPTMPPYPDWSSSMQAYYSAGPAAPYFASTVASPPPHPHPYVWGGQHPLMSPYGTPVPYPALYPPGAIYAHPNVATPPGMAPGTTEAEAKAGEGKDRTGRKKSKGTSGNHTVAGGKTAESGAAASGSGNDGATQSVESGTDGSSDASEENNSNNFSGTKKGSFNQMLADGANAQSNMAAGNFRSSVHGNSLVPVPLTNLNIGMNFWNGSAAPTGAVKMHPNSSGMVPGVAPTGMVPDQWVQDERELKRQKRKQSNRESARRSRLRKQAECEELQQRVEALSGENSTLKDELQRLSEECEKLTSENNSIKEELTRLCGPEALSKLESNSSGLQLEPRAEKGNNR